MLDSIIEMIPFLRNSLLNNREKRLIAIVIVISLPLTVFLVSFTLAYAIVKNQHADSLQDDEISGVPAAPRIIKYDALEKDALRNFLIKIYNEGDFKYAEDIANKITLSDSTDNLAFFVLAKIKIENKKYGEARVIVNSLKSKNFMLDSLKTLSISLVEIGELKEIIGDTVSLSATQLAKVGERLFAEVKDNKDNDYWANVFIAKAIEKDSTNPEALYQSARLNMNNKKYAVAEKQIKTLLSQDSTSARNLGRYAILLHETGRNTLALVYYRKAVEKNMYDFNLIYNLGELYHSSLNDRENAKKCFLRVVELSPDTWQGYFKLGVISSEENDFNAAIYYFTKAGDFSPNNTRILHMLATAYERYNEKDMAMETYDRILKINPDDDIALYKRRNLNDN
ncbi:MAG: tetratricopeptide repeat protein [Chitinivibrionia bacterium]|nr:tetratricopeptide repeat protein [Chitinivibrionia bacterium]